MMNNDSRNRYRQQPRHNEEKTSYPTTQSTERPNVRAGNLARSRDYDSSKSQRYDSRRPMKTYDKRSYDRSCQQPRKPYTGKSSGYKKRTPEKQKFNIPPFMLPVSTITASNYHAFAEEGCCIETYRSVDPLATREPIRIRGSAKVIASSNGSPKRPVFVLSPRSISSAHSKSMMFLIQNGDLVVTVSKKSARDDGDKSYVSVYVFRANRSNRNVKSSKESTVQFIPIFVNTWAIETSEFPKLTEIDSRTIIVMNKIRELLFAKKLEMLMPAVAAALDKTSDTETSYRFYHNSKLADKHAATENQ